MKVTMMKYWIWLTMVTHVGPVLQKRLLDVFKSPEAVYESSEEELRKVKGMNRRAVKSILANRSLEKAKQISESAWRNNIHLLRFDDSLYPEHAKACPLSPILLYYQGKIHPIKKAVAIVGTRRCTPYGRELAQDLATELASNDVPVISGLAKGIDSYAHTACIQNGGYTLAIVANGVNYCYPREHQPLYESIVENGAVLSQYPPNSKPHPKHFFQRNALISAWSESVVIVEAGAKSGALTTAKYAEKNQRKLYAVPNRIDIPEAKGTNRLLAEGATPYLGFESLNISQTDSKSNNYSNRKKSEPTNERTIMEILKRGPLPMTLLAEKLHIEDKALIGQLCTLELEGKVYMRGEIVAKRF
jgi:DNA processing protein